MKVWCAMSPGLPQFLRPVRDIPNTPGFSLVVHRGAESFPARVERGADGCHFLVTESGARVGDILSLSGWVSRKR